MPASSPDGAPDGGARPLLSVAALRDLVALVRRLQEAAAPGGEEQGDARETAEAGPEGDRAGERAEQQGRGERGAGAAGVGELSGGGSASVGAGSPARGASPGGAHGTVSAESGAAMSADAAPGMVRDQVSAPGLLGSEPRIRSPHLSRQALIYVRQSHPNQVQRHPESARRQYRLVERAAQLGWPRDQIVVIDDDQGKSGAARAASQGRDGFARLVAAVSLGKVGLVLALEVARLARNSAEWNRLLNLASYTGTLIADDATVYDPRLFNDRLLLGLRGTISEVELHCIQERLQGARLSKAQRGELPVRVPAGYLAARAGQVDVDPDQEVQGAIRTIFTQFERLGTVTAVLHFFNDHGLLVPRRRWHAARGARIVWLRPSYQALHTVLTNPVYAGTYVYGQRGLLRGTALGRGHRHGATAMPWTRRQCCCAIITPPTSPGSAFWQRGQPCETMPPSFSPAGARRGAGTVSCKASWSAAAAAAACGCTTETPAPHTSA